MFMYVNVNPKLYRQYAETWVFGMFSCCVRQGKYIWGLCHWCSLPVLDVLMMQSCTVPVHLYISNSMTVVQYLLPEPMFTSCRPWRTNFSEIVFKMKTEIFQENAFHKMVYANCQPFWPGPNFNGMNNKRQLVGYLISYSLILLKNSLG